MVWLATLCIGLAIGFMVGDYLAWSNYRDLLRRMKNLQPFNKNNKRHLEILKMECEKLCEKEN